MMLRPLSRRRDDTNVILITLQRTPERTQQALSRFASLGVTPQILWASDGKDAAASQTFPRDPDSTKIGHLMQDGEVGCAMSWWRAAAMIVRNNWSHAIVFEDDFFPLASWAQVTKAVAELPAFYDIALLHNQHEPEPAVAPAGHTKSFRRVNNPSWTTVSLAISNHGARAILRGLAPFDRPVDVWIRDNPEALVIYQPHAGGGWFRQDQWGPSTIRANHNAGSIPKVLHRIWVGPNPIPDEHEAFWRSWQKHHPGWAAQTWLDDDIAAKFGDNPAIEAARLLPPEKRWAAISDIARLLILERFGGLYVDTDFECVRSFQKCIDSAAVLLADMTDGDPCNGLMASVPGHLLLKQLSWRAQQNVLSGEGSILEQAGPRMVKDVLAEWLPGWPKDLIEGDRVVGRAIGDTGITILQPWVCFPYYWRDPRPKKYGAAYAAHHWARSWWGEEEWAQHRQALLVS